MVTAALQVREHAERLGGLSFAIGTYRPPSEGGSASLLLRFSENCPWNRCGFCEMYKGRRFGYRGVDAIVADIDAVAEMRDTIIAASDAMGLEGMLTRELAGALLHANPALAESASFVTVFNWLACGARTAFLQDADSMSMRPAQYVQVLRHLRATLPTLERVTTYARSKTLFKRSADDLRAIREAGLDRVHVGLETGDDELLARIDKGVTQAEQIEGGRRARAAGLQVSMYWMPDLGGRERWREHALNTAQALSAIDPHYIRSRPLVPREGTPLHDAVVQGRVSLSSPHERLRELELMIGALEVSSRVCFDHAMNAWVDGAGRLLFRQDYEGYAFPQEKEDVLERIRLGLAVEESRHVHVRHLMAAHTL